MDKVLIKWECDWLAEMANPNHPAYAFFSGQDKKLKRPPRLKIRESLKGGVTEVFSLAAEVSVTDEYRLLYYDWNRDFVKTCITYKFDLYSSFICHS